jgi:NAD(P)-dependent dehydrogenase (short-subunit alcohol dehydrogenase family)
MAPDLIGLNINFIGAAYSAMLGMKYMRLNPIPGGDIILTSSSAGMYPQPIMPFYCAAKHGVVGLGRALGGRLEKEGIRVNVLVPGMVPTKIMSQSIIDATNPAYLTPASHMAKAVTEILDMKLSGALCECSVDKIYYRDPPEFPDIAQKTILTGTSDWLDDYAKREPTKLEKALGAKE